MSWHYSRALVAAYLAESSTDGERFALLRSSDMPATYCWHDKTTEALPLFQYGTTCEHSTADPGADLLTWYLAAFPARTSPPVAATAVLPAQNLAYGSRCSASSTNAARHSYMLKTAPACGNISTELPASWPAWGMIVGGVLSALNIAAPLINGTGSGSLLPTPTAGDAKASGSRNMGPRSAARMMSLTDAALGDGGQGRRPGAGFLNPSWVEWLMGWPIGWTDLQPLATDKYQRWLLWHGIS